jgi:hypothetical protein
MPDSEAYTKNTTENYAALGRFVEAFELMVDDVRQICIERICSGIGSSERLDLIELPFHHGAMTAKPLFDIMRAVIIEIVNKPGNFHYPNLETFKTLLGLAEAEYGSLINKRNELLHGTWFVGFPTKIDPEAKEFFVRKFKTSGDGLIAAQLPKNADELSALTKRCDEMRLWLGQLDFCLQDGIVITDFFTQIPSSKRWKCSVSYDGAGTILPRK